MTTPLTDDELRAMRERVTYADTVLADASVNSACGESNCDCHRDMPRLLDEIDRLRAMFSEIEQMLEIANARAKKRSVIVAGDGTGEGN